MVKRTPVKLMKRRVVKGDIAVIGIDGGLTGACASVGESLVLLNFWDMPVLEYKKKIKKGKRKGKYSTSHDFDPRGMYTQLLNEKLRLQQLGYNVRVVLERAHAMAQQGLSSTFTTGRGFGLIEMAVVALGVPYETITARTWQKVVLKGTKGEDTKQRSLLKASQVFPGIKLTLPTGKKLSLDGRSDASLIAYYSVLMLRRSSDV